MARRRNSLANLLSGNSFSNYGEVPTIAVGDSAFTPSVFSYTPLELKPQDYSILQRSMALQEQRERDAQEKFEKLNQTLGAAKAQLYDSPDNQEYIARRQDELFAPVNQALALGDYASAIQEAAAAGAKFANDNEFIGRLKTTEDYNNEIKTLKDRVARGEISQNTYDWWTKKNPFTFVPKYANDGKTIIGGEKYNPTSRPVKDIHEEDIFKQAFEMVTEDRGTSSSKRTNKDGSGSGGSSGFHTKAPKDILAAARRLISSNSEYAQAIQQRYWADKSHLDEMKQSLENMPEGQDKEALKAQINQLSEMFEENDQMTSDYNKYFDKLILNSPYAQSLGYDWRDVASDIDESTSASRNAGLGGGGQYTDREQTPPSETVNGPVGKVIKKRKQSNSSNLHYK